MRICHLIDASAGAAPTTLALLRASLGRLSDAEQHVLLLGGETLRRDAVSVGITDAQHASVPMGRALAGWSVVRSALKQLGPIDLIHCWSAGTLTLTTLLFGHIPRLFTVTMPPSPRGVHWLRVMAQQQPTRTVFLPISHTIGRSLLGGGLDQSAVHVLRPGLDMRKVVFAQRDALRRSWGINHDQTKVVALLCDPPTCSDALVATMAVNLAADSMEEASHSLTLLMHPDQVHSRRARRMVQQLGHLRRVITESTIAQPWRVLPGCDYVLAAGSGAGHLSLLWAMAANVPIVAEACYAVSEIVEDRHSALLASPNKPTALAHRIRQLYDDPQLAWQLRDTARHEAYSFFSRQRYCENLTTVYHQMIAGECIEIPPMEVTGGLRFAGGLVT